MKKLQKIYTNFNNLRGSMVYNYERGLTVESFTETMKKAGFELIVKDGSDYKIGDYVAVLGMGAAIINVMKVIGIKWKDKKETIVDYYTVDRECQVDFLDPGIGGFYVNR